MEIKGALTGLKVAGISVGITLLILVGFIFFAPGFFSNLFGRQVVLQSGTDAEGGSANVNVYTGNVNLKVSGHDSLNGSLQDLNAELWTSTHAQIAGETAVPNVLTSLTSTGPNNLNGYVMIGNDNFESATDQGTEYYYTQYPVSYSGHSGDISFERIPVWQEGTVTWTGYEDGTSESTLNISVGSGARVTTGELKLEVSADSYLGNPDPLLVQYCGNERIALAFNQTTDGVLKEVRPTNIAGDPFTAPGFLSGRNVIDNLAYKLPITYLSDNPSQGGLLNYKFPFVIEAEAGQNPGVTDISYAHPLDCTWYKDDNLKWVGGWGDESTSAADTDIGMTALNNVKQIGLQ